MPLKIESLCAKAQALRADILAMIAAVGTGHPGSSLSAIDIMTCLYYRVMRLRPGDPQWPERDRFLLGKGHAAPALYAILIDLGILPREVAGSLRQIGSPLQGHPDRRFTAGVEASTGSLGQALSMGVGMALGARHLGLPSRVFVLLGDGECQEGQVWEAALSAAQLGLESLCAVIDFNGLQHDGPVDEILGLEPLAGKWRAFGWEVREVDGHNFRSLLRALTGRPRSGRPRAVIARTVKGKGVDFMENRHEWHSVQDASLLAERFGKRGDPR
jgi:transketolase